MVPTDMNAPTTTSSYVRSVAADTKSLRECLDAGQSATGAISALVERARGGLAELGTEPDELGQVAARLAVAGALLAADHATMPGAEPGARAELVASANELTETGRALEEAARATAFGFAPNVPVSPTAEAAADQLRKQAGDTLEAMVEEIAGLLRLVSDKLSRHSVKDALSAVGGEPRLGEWASEATAVAKRLIEWVLGRLVRLLPAGHLDELKKKVSDLLAATDLRGVVAVALGVPETSKRIEGWLSASGLDPACLDDGTAELMKLEHRYARQMRWAHHSITAILSLSVVGLVAPAVAVPQAALVVPMLLLTVTCVALGLSFEYAGSAHWPVVGVGGIVRTACEVRP
jgi:hypothetical protein